MTTAAVVSVATMTTAAVVTRNDDLQVTVDFRARDATESVNYIH